MIREQRSEAFWQSIAEDETVRPHTLLEPGAGWAEFLSRPDVMPLATDLGGYVFAGMDCLGRTWELHSLFLPQAWGRHVAYAGREALETLQGWDLIVTQEVGSWWRSRPPKSFGFRPAGEFHPSPVGELRTWILTRSAWEQSPARRRME